MGKKNKIGISFFKQYRGRSYRLRPYRPFILQIVQSEQIPVSVLHVIGVDDEYLRQLHARFLQVDTYTDVMTFPLEEEGEGEAEIYISIEQATRNAARYQVSLECEIARLLAHGLLHLKGFDDADEAGRDEMHHRENLLLEKFWKPE